MHPRVAMLRTTLKAEWKPAGYPSVLNHLGDHIRRRRLEIGLLQKDVAEQIGTHVQTVRNWEMGETSPALPWLPGIIGFLGYDPRPLPEAFSERLKHHRVGLGMSQESFARRLGVDPGTLGRWESARRRPQGEHATRVNAAFKARKSLLTPTEVASLKE